MFESFREWSPGLALNPEVWLSDDGGSNPQNLTKCPGSSWCPSHAFYDVDPVFCKGKIVFVSDRDQPPLTATRTDVFVMDQDGSNPQNLTPLSPDYVDQNPDCGQFSLSGFVIVFVREQFNVAGSRDIYRINSDGTGLMQLTSQAGDDIDPTWCGDKIVFASQREGGLHLFSMDQYGGSVRQLTCDGNSDCQPACSPDRQFVAFERIANANCDVFRIPLCTGQCCDDPAQGGQGQGEQRLTFGTAVDYEPVYSPGGLVILFSSDRLLAANFSMFKMDADVGEAVDPAAHLDTQCPPAGPCVDTDPDWAEVKP